MTITLDMSLFLSILALLGCVAMVFLIIFLKKLAEILRSVDTLIKENRNSIGLTVANLPSITGNVDTIVGNAKDITEDAAVIKDRIKSGVSTSVDVVKIVKDTIKK